MQGVVGAFHEIDTTVAAIEDLKKKKLGEVTVYSPTIRHELEHAIDAPQRVVRRFTLIGGLLGVSFGYWVAIWSSTYWPLVVGGKAIASWIPYTIIGFEMMVLVGALSTVAGMLGGMFVGMTWGMVVSVGLHRLFFQLRQRRAGGFSTAD